MVMNADKFFPLDSIWLATLSFSLLVCFQLDKEYYYSLTSHSSVCHMHDPNGSHSVENEKSVKSTGLFFPLLDYVNDLYIKVLQDKIYLRVVF